MVGVIPTAGESYVAPAMEVVDGFRLTTRPERDMTPPTVSVNLPAYVGILVDQVADHFKIRGGRVQTITFVMNMLDDVCKQEGPSPAAIGS